tara:strand:+ start:10265 stop:12004 length:1740 start_codon:yes stop_codon:yes gene_type:complete
MAESKRTFQAARMNKDIEEKILKPGEYRDALNVSVDFSEDGNIGAIENLKGNELLAGQDILGLSSSSNPNAKVIGSIAHPEEEKIYFFVTGDKMDGIFEYDLRASSNQTKPIILDSSVLSTTINNILTFSEINATAGVAQDGTISVDANIDVESLTPNFSPNTTGSNAARKVTIRGIVPDEFDNGGEMLVGSVSATQASIAAPEVITLEPLTIGETTATLSASLTNDSVNVTSQGFYYGFKVASNTALTISELISGGTGITRFTVTNSNVRNSFTKDITSLTSSKLISFAGFAINSVGTGNGNVKTFTTKTPPPANRISGNEYVIVPAIGDVTAGNATDEIVDRNIGYGSFFKASGDCYLNIAAPSNDGLRANATNTTSLHTNISGFSSSPSGLTFAKAHGGNSNTKSAAIYVSNFSANTSYQITVPAITGIQAQTIRINKGTPSGTYFTSTLNLSLGMGLFLGNADIPAAYEYNHNTSIAPNATYILGPVLSGEKAKCVIPLNNTAAVITSTGAGSFASSFNASNLSVTVVGKTEGVDFDYYVEDTSTAILGTVPGIIFEGTPSLLGSTPTVNINYTT